MDKAEHDAKFETLLVELTQAKLAVDDASQDDLDERRKLYEKLRMEFTIFCNSHEHQ
jgi:hypothetical protein